MNKKDKTALVPRLRFPEFKSAKEWAQKSLGDVTYTISTRNSEGKKYPIYSINNKEGFLPQSDQFEGIDSNLRGYDIRLYKIVDKNTFAYNPARINVGSIGYSGELFDIIISSLYVCFKTNEEVEDEFLQCFLKTSVFNRQVENNSEGGIRSYLFYENFSKICLQFPQNAEQVKISECLSSLDDLIMAEDKKLDALKVHKKGLMQKLFPTQGKSIPEWRFPEFRGKKEWKEKPLGSITIKVGSGTTPLGGETNYKKSGRPFIRSQNVGWGYLILDDIAYIDESTHQESISTEVFSGDTLLNITGASIGRSAVANYRVNGGNVNQHVCIIRTIADVLSPWFLNQYFLSVYGQMQIESFQAGGNRLGLNFAQIRSFSIPLPSKIEEQHRIADCLTSLDDLVAVQTSKINALKEHKKGLMQGLFTSIEEVSE